VWPAGTSFFAHFFMYCIFVESWLEKDLILSNFL
jgi:hypothetical protein